MTIEEMSTRMSEAQSKLAREVCQQTKEIPCFECGGLLFRGRRTTAAMEFAYNNPTGGDFYVWLQDHYEIITTLK